MKIDLQKIGPHEIISWFRAKAYEFERIATALETTFDAQGQPSLKGQQSEAAKNGGVKATLENVKDAISMFAKGARVSTIAKSLGSEVEDVSEIISKHPTAFEMRGRGWWTVKG